MKSPLVSIITPCFNAEKYLSKLLDSVLNQSYESIELIVVNDGSTDGSLNILEGYKKTFLDRNIEYHIISKTNGGAASAINKGLEIFTGKYLTFIDADDFLNENSIAKRVEFLENNIKYDAVYSATNVVDESDYDKVVKIKREERNPPRENLFVDMLIENDYIWTPHTYLVRSDYFLQVNPERHIEEFEAGQNIQIFLPMWHKATVGYIDEPLVTIVQHRDSHSRAPRTDDELIARRNEINHIYLDTLSRIDMLDDERKSYEALLQDKNRKKEKRIFQKIASNKDELGQLYEYDEQKFRNSYVSNINIANQHQLAAKLIFSAHSLEKSLSNDNFEIGHGFKVSRMLVEMLVLYREKGYDQTDLAYINTLSVLRVFLERHEGSKYTAEIEGIFGDLLHDIKGCSSTIGGSDEIFIEQKLNNHNKNFKDLARDRYSVRMYSNEPVSRNDIKEVVQIAMKTPTVCNRQSLRVHAMYNKELIEKVLKIQGGIAHYDTPPVLLLITADDNGYVGANERNQGFIDGGLFAMSMLYALEYKGLAACPLHAMLTEVKEMSVRGLLNLPDNEKFITFMSVGHFNKVNNVCKSFRYDADHVLVENDVIHNFEISTVPLSAKNEDDIKDVVDSMWLQIRKKVRLRTRLRSLKRRLRLRTRIREYIKIRKIKKEDSLRAEIQNSPEGAILTLTDYHNYGNILQRYALQKFLSKHNHRLISYAQEPFEVSGSKFDKFRNTIRFVEHRIPRKRPDSNDNYSLYISGSDQVWRKWGGTDDSLLERVRYYFFDSIGTDKAKRIAYAASFGHDSIELAGLTPEFMKSVKKLVKKIDAISMRENSGINIVKKWWGVDATLAVDPTMLLTKSDYNNLISNSTCKLAQSKPMFAYVVLDLEKRRKDDIRHLEQVYQLSSDATSLRDVPVLPPVEQWLQNIRDAEIVVTDSFHGVVFSIIYNTPFIVLINQFGGVSRIETLLSELGLEDRLLRDEDILSHTANSMKDIDWRLVNKRVTKLRKRSGKWLLDSIKS